MVSGREVYSSILTCPICSLPEEGLTHEQQDHRARHLNNPSVQPRPRLLLKQELKPAQLELKRLSNLISSKKRKRARIMEELLIRPDDARLNLLLDVLSKRITSRKEKMRALEIEQGNYRAWSAPSGTIQQASLKA